MGGEDKGTPAHVCMWGLRSLLQALPGTGADGNHPLCPQKPQSGRAVPVGRSSGCKGFLHLSSQSRGGDRLYVALKELAMSPEIAEARVGQSRVAA